MDSGSFYKNAKSRPFQTVFIFTQNNKKTLDSQVADSLKEAVRFCHARGVAVHVALNTTVYGGELAGFL